MISVARLKQGGEAPLHGALLGLLLLATGWLIGLPNALGFERPNAIPVAFVLGAVLGRWLLKPMFIVTVTLMVCAAIGIWSPLVPELAKPFVRNDRVDLDKVDAVFVFSNAVNSHGLVSGEGVDRLLTGIALRARRPALPLLVSTVRSTDRNAGISSMADQRALISLVPASGPVEWIDSVHSTRDEAVRLTRRAFLQRWKRVAVVTSPMHTRRACATVEALGLAVTCVAAPWRPAGWPPRTAGDRIVVMQRLVYEILAWAQYRVTGWARWA
ncbi:MAG: YdcF family protein [Gemmatimonadaceae bacterium]|nr:YdcF family protein [Gemmatimonadaceae bacterium]